MSTELVTRLNGLGVERSDWTPSAYVTFSHSGGRTHMSEVERFFDEAVELSREAAAEIETLRKRVKWLDALEVAGVDNWDGISHAHDILEEADEA